MNPGPPARTKPEPRERAPIYWKKAVRFAHAATTNASERDWDPAVANAINAVINVVDAFCVHYQGLRGASSSHADALQLLDGCRDLDSEVRSLLKKHLGALLGRKGLAQYEGRLLAQADADEALRHLERALNAARPKAEALGWAA